VFTKSEEMALAQNSLRFRCRHTMNGRKGWSLLGVSNFVYAIFDEPENVNTTRNSKISPAKSDFIILPVLQSNKIILRAINSCRLYDREQ
jgi:hypothetical protein